MTDRPQPSGASRSAVKDRIKNLEARSRTPGDAYDKASALASRVRTAGDIIEASSAVARLRSQCEHDAQLRPRRKLANISEQRVLKTGIVWLRSFFVGKSTRPVVELERRKDGSPLFMQASFFKRLLADNIELKVCMDSDVSAAQSDIRYLTLEQLLTIRAGTLDFSTVSDSHSAHAGFLYTIDAHLFNKLARACLRQGSLPISALPKKPEAWHAFGVQIALVLGAIELLANGWDSNPKHIEADVTLPAAWTLPLDEESWKGCRAAVFHSTEVWFSPLTGEQPDFSAFGQVAVVSSETVGIGQDRSLHWEIAVLDAQTEDVMAEMMRKDSAEKSKGRLSMELSHSLKQRFSTRMEALGLAATPRQPSPEADARQKELSVLKTPTRTKVADRVASIQSEQENITPPRVLTLMSRSQSERHPLKTNIGSALLHKGQSTSQLPKGDADVPSSYTSLQQPPKANLISEIVEVPQNIGDATSSSSTSCAHPNDGNTDILAIAKALELMDRDLVTPTSEDYADSNCVPNLPLPCCSGSRRIQYPRIDDESESPNCPQHLQGGIYCMSR